MCVCVGRWVAVDRRWGECTYAEAPSPRISAVRIVQREVRQVASGGRTAIRGQEHKMIAEARFSHLQQ